MERLRERNACRAGEQRGHAGERARREVGTGRGAGFDAGTLADPLAGAAALADTAGTAAA